MNHLWLRVGDDGSHQDFGDNLFALIDYLNDLRVGQVLSWVNEPAGIGFETCNYRGLNFISLYWGDKQAKFINTLDNKERRDVESRLKKVCFSPAIEE